VPGSVSRKRWRSYRPRIGKVNDLLERIELVQRKFPDVTPQGSQPKESVKPIEAATARSVETGSLSHLPRVRPSRIAAQYVVTCIYIGCCVNLLVAWASAHGGDPHDLRSGEVSKSRADFGTACDKSHATAERANRTYSNSRFEGTKPLGVRRLLNISRESQRPVRTTARLGVIRSGIAAGARLERSDVRLSGWSRNC